jgi:hypothetical protein
VIRVFYGVHGLFLASPQRVTPKERVGALQFYESSHLIGFSDETVRRRVRTSHDCALTVGFACVGR